MEIMEIKEFTTKHVGLGYEEIQEQVKFLQGKTLTVLEASIENDRKLKATKDIVKKMFSEQLSRIAAKCFPELPVKSEEYVKEMNGGKIPQLGEVN